MQPVPIWARVAAVVVGALTAIFTIATVIFGAAALLSVNAELDRTSSFTVGSAPHLTVDAEFGSVTVVAGPDGRIDVDDRRSATSITRAGAGPALAATDVTATREGDAITVTQSTRPLQPLSTDREATITVRVPVHTNVDVLGVSHVVLEGIDGVVQAHGTGGTTLRDVVLRGTSTFNLGAGDVVMQNVTVSGRAEVIARTGEIRFDGRLAPGGSALDIDSSVGDVTVALPHPTDARAAISTQVGRFTADPAWQFIPDQDVNTRGWAADLGPSPTGTVTIRAALGGVHFEMR